MKLELRRATDGTHLMICVCSEHAGRQIVIPLAPGVSAAIARMIDAEQVHGRAPDPAAAHPKLSRRPVRCRGCGNG